jgi:hypothetical protein
VGDVGDHPPRRLTGYHGGHLCFGVGLALIILPTHCSAFYGMSARRVADTEGIPLGTAKTRILDGVQKLRAAFLLREADNHE